MYKCVHYPASPKIIVCLVRLNDRCKRIIKTVNGGAAA